MHRNAKQPVPPTERLKSYRNRMRASGFKLVQIWVPDPQAPGFAAKCKRQALAIAKHDPAGVEVLRFIQATYE